jgi:hypothetical protein
MQLCDKYGVGFCDNFYTRLSLGPPWLPLTIEKHGSIIGVNHYFQEQDRIFYDPYIEFYIVSTMRDYPEWVPLWMQNMFCIFPCADTDESSESGYWVHDRKKQREIADSAEIWAKNIRTHGWIERAQIVESYKWDDG